MWAGGLETEIVAADLVQRERARRGVEDQRPGEDDPYRVSAGDAVTYFEARERRRCYCPTRSVTGQARRHFVLMSGGRTIAKTVTPKTMTASQALARDLKMLESDSFGAANLAIDSIWSLWTLWS